MDKAQDAFWQDSIEAFSQNRRFLCFVKERQSTSNDKRVIYFPNFHEKLLHFFHELSTDDL